MTLPVVVIPWWPETTDEWRYRWRDQVTALWVSRGYRVIHGIGVEGAARNRGIELAAAVHGTDIILICTDADALITAEVAALAVEYAKMRPGVVIPHDRYVYLTEKACLGLTAEIAAGILHGHEGRWPFVETPEGLIEATGPTSVGGPAVFSFETWKQAGGYDETLIRAYDSAFALAAGTLVGPQERLAGDFVHLWHPRPEEEPAETWEVIALYHAAASRGIRAMADLVASRKP